ncbi:hypothetical protein [Herbidospora cretacea]|uniref:hypothetical protein n=1 Tax=Herbidospora cretacea TaxID=28444 RepID=UPI0012F8EF89|nr:hypothetical protein [Herbidospora cretacea]
MAGKKIVESPPNHFSFGQGEDGRVYIGWNTVTYSPEQVVAGGTLADGLAAVRELSADLMEITAQIVRAQAREAKETASV